MSISKALFTGMAIFFIAMLVSCSSEEVERKIDGEWVGRLSDVDTDGTAIDMKMYFNFSKETHTFRLKLNVSESDFGRLGSVRCQGSWQADEEDIMLDVDKETVQFKFDESLTMLSNMSGIPTYSIEQELKEEVAEYLEGLAFIPIKHVSETSLKLEVDDGEVVTFKRPL